ncbi:M48 family metallopeptidase [Carboxydothermus islandicus]|uniref:M48 family metallopeptidase n=1 Tax=Carboxydothermus islandicus TaxID=661089 RepID=UPI00096A6B6E|nr:SprT family zinc-dependent metalloprotease [Carboxydothermus islandicus]
MPQIRYRDEVITYQVIRKKKKHIGIIISPEGKVVVTATFSVPDNFVEKVVLEKARWISEKLKQVQRQREAVLPKEYVSGESFLYLGRNIRLKIITGNFTRPEVRLYRGRLMVYLPESIDKSTWPEVVRQEITAWHKQRARERLLERTNYYAQKLNLYPNNIRIKDQKSLWGSCSSKGNINYNWRLIMAPIGVIDYIVVHELCHLKYKNHSPKFWQRVGYFLHDYKEKKEWLKANGRKLFL